MSVDLDTRVEPRTFANDYRDRHPAFFRTARHFGTFGLIDAYQDAGDVAPGESENLLVGRTLSRGYCEADLGGGRYKAPFSKGSLFLGRPGYGNKIVADHPHRIEILFVPWRTLRDLDVGSDLPPDADFGKALTQVIHDPATNAWFDGVSAAADAQMGSLLSQTLLTGLIARLSKWQHAPKKRQRRVAERLSRNSLRLSTKRIASLELPSPTLNELAAICDLSPHHFCRAFRAEIGLPPHRYQMVRRVERARELLRDTDLSIAAVGEAVGYDDPGYFSRLFKRETGFAPREMRNELAS